MKHLFKAWKQVKALIQAWPVMLFLDYDGTLTPIVSHSREARLGLSRKKKLKALSRLPEVNVVVISGRCLGELKKFVQVPRLTYAGNHGLEISGPKMNYIHPVALKSKTIIQKIFRELEKKLNAIPGLFVENKIFTISVHYRLASTRNTARARQLFEDGVLPYLTRSEVTVTQGKKVWEVRPATPWNKGMAALWILESYLMKSGKQALPIYIGDDKTDESAFEKIRPWGLSVKVARNKKEKSKAFYSLRSPDEVFKFLREVENIKGGKYAGRAVRKDGGI